MSRRRGNAITQPGRNRAGATIEKPKKERRRAVSNVGDIIARLLCDDPNCVGEVGKFSKYYMEYIAAFLKGKPNPNFIQQWDNAIVLQLKGQFGIRNIDQLYKSNYYKTVTLKRQEWLGDAQKMGYNKWLSWAKAEKAKRQKGMTLRSGKVVPRPKRKIQLKF